jgi:hypothetical protein
MTNRCLFAAITVITLAPAAGAAQGYRGRIDLRAQSVSFRGLVADSIPIASVVTGPNGERMTPDGHVVRCSAGAYCFFYRPGRPLRALPVTTSASVILWGLGVQGLTIRATGRLLADLGRDDVWPGTDPSAQLLEAYAEYQRASFVVRGGRQLVSSRLEPLGFDGAWLKYRHDRAALELAGYAGWGLGQAAALPVSSPALNPLDEWRPRDRQVVLGTDAGWRFANVDLRGEYRREIDPEDYSVVSERAGVSFNAPAGQLPVNVAAGFDYNIAEGHAGSADLRVTYVQPRYSLSAGARRYRPYFSLWTLWSAFSPVPHNGVNLSAEFRATPALSLRARGEAYRYENAEVSTALVPDLQDRGWRASSGGTLTLRGGWTVDANAGVERGPGAAGRFADAAVRWTPNDRYAVDLYGGAVARPLELRYYDATSQYIGAQVQLFVTTDRRLWSDVAFVNDDRDRPDASASSLDQVRVRAGLSIALGTTADRLPLPPARRAR